MQRTLVTQPLHHPLQAVTKQGAQEAVLVPAIDDQNKIIFLFIGWPGYITTFKGVHESSCFVSMCKKPYVVYLCSFLYSKIPLTHSTM